MVAATSQPSQLTHLELWALAQIVASKPVSPELPVSGPVWRLLNDLSIISPEWRMLTISQRLGSAYSDQIKAIDPALPMPGIPARPSPFTAPNPPPPMEVVKPGAPQKTHFIPADDLKHLPPPKYALDKYPVYAASLNALVGPSGGGKSFVCIDIAGLMARQMMQAGDNQSIIYIAAEGLFGYAPRWEVWKAHHGLTNCPNLIFYDQPVNFLDPAGVTAFMTSIAQYKPYMVMVDTVARCMTGGDENSTRDMGLFVSACDRLIHEMQAGVIAVHHTGKDGKMRGSSALFGACDSVLFLNRVEGRITLFNSLDHGGKNKYSAEAAAIDLQLLSRKVTVADKEFSSAVLVKPSQIIDKPDYIHLTDNERLALEALDAHDDTGLKGSQVKEMASIPESSVWRVLKSLQTKKLVISMPDGIYKITPAGIDLSRRNLEF
jgi:hypothetical protein